MTAVASVAWQQMRPDTRRAVARLLAQGRLLETPTCPVATIEQASVWADCIKPLGDRFAMPIRGTIRMSNVCKPFDLKAACKDGHCVSAQIERNARLLADPDGAAAREGDGAGLPRPLRRRPSPADARRRPWRPWRQQGAGQLRADRRADQFAQHLGRLAGRARDHHAAGRRRGLLARGHRRPSAQRIAGGTVEEWSREMWGKARDLAYKTIIADPCGAPPADAPDPDRGAGPGADPGGARKCRRRRDPPRPAARRCARARSTRRRGKKR